MTVLGAPAVVSSDVGPAVAFNGTTDGLLLDTNPLQGLDRFTIEVLFSNDLDGPEEQRFLHIEEAGTANRAMVELRHRDRAFGLDTYLRHGDAQLTLLDRAKTHPAGEWHVAALTFDGATMTHFVDGVRELSGEVAFRALGPGRTSIGVRQNQVSPAAGSVISYAGQLVYLRRSSGVKWMMSSPMMSAPSPINADTSIPFTCVLLVSGSPPRRASSS